MKFVSLFEKQFKISKKNFYLSNKIYHLFIKILIPLIQSKNKNEPFKPDLQCGSIKLLKIKICRLSNLLLSGKKINETVFLFINILLNRDKFKSMILFLK